MAFSVKGQSGIEEKSNTMNGFFGFDGLRPNNPDLLYNQRFLKDSTYFYTKDSLEAEFREFKKVTFDYDNQGRLLLENEFEKKADVWLESIKRIFSYDNDGAVEYRVLKQWDSSNESFENQRRTFYTRNFMGLVSRETIEKYESNEWMLDSKQEYFYNAHYDISEEVSYTWLTPNMVWEPKRRKIREFNEDQELSSEVIQVWVDSLNVWVNMSHRRYEYNSDNQLINLLESMWNTSLEQWVEQSVQALSYNPLGQVENSNSFDALDPDGDTKESVEATYDEDGNLNITLFKEWNSDQNAWNAYERHVHFWSEYLIGNLDGADKNIECFFMNPHTVGLPWSCDELLENEVYLLSVYDQNGILHHSQQFRGRDTFRLTKNLNNGLYMVVITGGLTTHTEKVLIKN
ncbi:MAG TPA: T9SS type A sorting domain-containing protein [Cryomorphaceae bacterium]|nr:T9SS type A sorting domain-containing protein [Cryomorphaceae bacterium]